MSLASALLKRVYVHRTLGVPWYSIHFGRRGDPVHGKPCYLLEDGLPCPNLDFNISHQAGLVVLVGCHTPSWDHSIGNKAAVEVGADITCVNERDDYRTIDTEGFEAFIDVFAEFFSPDELFDMKYQIAPDTITLYNGTELSAEELGRHDRCTRRNEILTITKRDGRKETFDSDVIIDAKLRRFYTFYAYKEAYIKLVGEGLLADWLKELEFQYVRAPKPGTVPRCSVHGVWGEQVQDAETMLKGGNVADVRMQVQAYEEKYLIAVAIRPGHLFPGELPPFKRLDLEQDILSYVKSK